MVNYHHFIMKIALLWLKILDHFAGVRKMVESSTNSANFEFHSKFLWCNGGAIWRKENRNNLIFRLLRFWEVTPVGLEPTTQ